MKFNKFLTIGFLLIALITLVALPIGFAADVDSIDLNSVVNTNMNNSIDISDYSLNSDLNSNIDYNDLNANSDTIYVNGSYKGSSELGTIANPYKTINKAMNAILNSSKTNLYIANGEYTISGAMDVFDDYKAMGDSYINIIGESKNGVSINCNDACLFNFNNFIANIYNLTVFNGFSNTNNTIINSIYSKVSLYDVIFRNNYAETPGGILLSRDGDLSLFNCSIVDNFIDYLDGERSSGISGGIIYSSNSNLNIINSLFKNNTIKSLIYSGGFIYFGGDYTFNCINSTFSDVYINATEVSGGIIYTNKLNFVNSSMDNININADSINGAFITCISNSKDSNIINSSFKNSKFTSICGLIYTNGYLNIYDSNITNNYAKFIQGNLVVYDEFNLSATVNLIIKDNHFDSIAYNLSKASIIYRADVFTLSIEDIESIPSSYDLRDYGWVSSVKDQGSSGSCWTFASIAAIESYLLKTYNLSADLSENNMRIIMSNESVNGSLWNAEKGGNDILAAAYLLRWSGAINESDDPFDPDDIIPKYDLPVSYHIQGLLYIPLRGDYLDNNQVKWAIMTYGALYTSTNSHTDFDYNPESKSTDPNHAVAIVGWDDNYVIDGAPSPGAFIIKNSWGADSGDEGYYYISYYAPCFAGFGNNVDFSALAVTDVENPDNYDNIYQYDIFGNDGQAVGFSSHEGWFANEFTANNDENLSAFGLYSFGPSNYSAYIYVNGKLVHTQSGTLSTTYQTIKLTSNVRLHKGDKFVIAIKLISPNSLHPIAIETSRDGFIKATANPNESFVSRDGVNWIDLTDIYEDANVCLKAYTNSLNPISMTITQTNTYYKSTYLTVSLSEKVNETIILNFSNGKTVNLMTKDGVATYYVPFAVGNYTVTGSLISDTYACGDVNIKFKINKATATITTYKLSTTYYSGDYFKVKVTDNNGKIMVGVKLTLKVYTGSKYKTVTVTTGTDGYAKYSASTLSITKHKVIVSSGESTKYMTASSKTNYITVSKGKTTVVAPKVTNNCGLNQYFKINVTRTIKKTPINAIALTVKVYKGSKLVKTYSVKTASNGIASINTKDLVAGTYNVRISSSNKYYTVSKSITAAIVMQKQKVAVTAKNTTNIYGKSQYFTITATKVDGGKVISGLTLTVKLYKNGKYVKKYSLKTNKNGAVSFNTKALTTGTYTIKVASANSKYTVSSANIGKLIMTKYKTNIIAPNVTNTYKKSQYFKINVTNKDTEKAISGLSIVVKVYKGSKLVKTYTTSTNTAGTASINTKDLAKGTYKVAISTKNVSYTVSKTIADAIKIK